MRSTLTFPVLRRLVLLLAVAFVFSSAARAEKAALLTHTGRVNDFAGVINAPAAARLTAISREVDAKANAQIIIVTIHSLEGAPIEDFANQLFHRWGVGKKGENRGVLILLAIADHKYRIEVGYGLEPILPDGKVGGFGRDAVPMLRQQNYGAALLVLTGRVAQAIATDRGISLASLAAPVPAVPQPPRPPASSPPVKRSYLGRLWADMLDSGLVGVAILMGAFWVFVFLLKMAWELLRLLIQGLVRKLTGNRNFTITSSSSSSSGGGGSGGGGFDSGSGGGSSDSGGFGGGDSGGGGASGSW